MNEADRVKVLRVVLVVVGLIFIFGFWPLTIVWPSIGHLWGDVLALFIVAIVLAVLIPGRSSAS